MIISDEGIRAELARRKLRIFVEEVWPIVEPGQPFVSNWHIDILCEVLEQITEGKMDRVIINVPPGTMKSLLVSVIWRAWMWARDPRLRFLAGSYGAHLSVRDNVKFRDIVSSEWFQTRYKCRLAGDQNEKVKIGTRDRGWSVATSVGGPGTGEHPDYIIIDDPLTAMQARSEPERNAANSWIDGTLSTRGAARGCKIVLIMQRLHEEDPTGHLLAKGGWEHICFPMRFESKRADKRDKRKVDGELLWPELFNEKKVRALEIALGPYDTAGQLQQRPAPEGGGMFKRPWFKIVDAAPSYGSEVRGWDTGGTEGGGDPTAGVKLRWANGCFYVMHVVKGQLGPKHVDDLIRNTAISDGRRCSVREEQEPGSAGKAVVATRARALAGFDYKGIAISGDKITRAKPFRAQCEAGNVFLVRGPWNEAYLDELCIFPNGAHDDQVDASSCAFNELTLGPKPVEEVEILLG